MKTLLLILISALLLLSSCTFGETPEPYSEEIFEDNAEDTETESEPEEPEEIFEDDETEDGFEDDKTEDGFEDDETSINNNEYTSDFFHGSYESIDIINDTPLYIGYVSVPAEEPLKRKETLILNTPKEMEAPVKYAILNFDYNLYDLRFIRVRSYDGINFYYDDLIQGLGWWSWRYCNIFFPLSYSEDIYYYAVTFTDNSEDGDIHSYLLTPDKVEKIEVQGRVDEYVTDDLNTISIKLWDYAEIKNTDYSDEENFSFVTMNISEENFLEDAVKAIYLHQGFSIKSIWYEGDKIYIDLSLIQDFRASRGSMAAIVTSNLLKRTFASFPNMTEMEFLVEGRVNPDFHNSNMMCGTFTVNGPLLTDITHKEFN
ncbi:MAG: hypothetical protein FWG70_08445 [Oscillospiraceae bacterium]|nr:hypothetical protein [Oscillospiraceae bacterium]